MKTISYLRVGLFQVILLGAVFLLASCNNETDTKEIAEDSNEEKFDDNDKERDAQFLVDAAEINLKEIQLGKLAQQKGVSPDVKELGRMMENAHTQLQNELTALAQRKMITIPTSPTEEAQDAYNSFNDKSGNDFDKEYADKMVDEHEDAIDVYEKAAQECNDADIRNWASSSLSGLRQHLDHANQCKAKTDKL